MMVFTSDGRRNKEIEALIGRAKCWSANYLLLCGDQVGVFKHRSCHFLNLVFILIKTCGHESCVMTGNVLSQVQYNRQRLDF